MHIFLPNTLIADRYQIVQIVGSDGLGAIYEARDLQYDMPVATTCEPHARGQRWLRWLQR